MRISQKFSKFYWSLITSLSLAFTLVILIGVMFNIRQSKIQTYADTACQQIIKSSALIKTSQLPKLQVKEGVTKPEILKILGDPYCVLPKASLRSGAITEREAYPLDNQSRLIVAYENGRYLGYGLAPLGKSPLNWLLGNSNPSVLKQIDLKRTWELNAGETIANHRVVGGLGEVSLEFNGEIRSPTMGKLEGNFVLVTEQSLIQGTSDCAIFSSPYYPAYLLKLCGLKTRNLGAVEAGSVLGQTNNYFHFAVLTYRPIAQKKSQWIYVAPSPKLIENLLKRP